MRWADSFKIKSLCDEKYHLLMAACYLFNLLSEQEVQQKHEEHQLVAAAAHRGSTVPALPLLTLLILPLCSSLFLFIFLLLSSWLIILLHFV